MNNYHSRSKSVQYKDENYIEQPLFVISLNKFDNELKEMKKII